MPFTGSEEDFEALCRQATVLCGGWQAAPCGRRRGSERNVGMDTGLDRRLDYFFESAQAACQGAVRPRPSTALTSLCQR